VQPKTEKRPYLAGLLINHKHIAWSDKRFTRDLTTRLDNSETPIDKLSEDVKLGAKLIKELSKKLKQVEMEVRDAFKELEDEGKEE
jgi:exodeoxyribonuclease VII small subunit